MAEYSLWLTGKLEGDNKKNIEWECSVCQIRVPEREAAKRHIQNEHKAGTLIPRLSKIGLQLVAMQVLQKASPDLAAYLAEDKEQEFCKLMGAFPIYVEAEHHSSTIEGNSEKQLDAGSVKTEFTFYTQPKVVEQTFFNTPIEFDAFLTGDVRLDDDIVILNLFPERTSIGYFRFIIGRILDQPLTANEKGKEGASEDSKQPELEQIELGVIEYRAFGDKTHWICKTNEPDVAKWAISKAIKIYKLHLGCEPIMSKDKEEGVETAVNSTIAGLTNPILSIAQDVAFNTTGVTVRDEVMNQSLNELRERSERLARMEEAKNPYNLPFSEGLQSALQDGFYEGAFLPLNSLVKSFVYPAGLKYFKVFMKRLIDSEFTHWTATNGVIVDIQDTFPPTRELPIARWHISTQLTNNPDAWATIIAFEQQPNQTTIDFYDGFNAISSPHKRPPLGFVLVEVANFIEQRVKNNKEFTSELTPKTKPIDISQVEIEDEVKGTATATLKLSGKLNPGYEHILTDRLFHGIRSAGNAAEAIEFGRLVGIYGHEVAQNIILQKYVDASLITIPSEEKKFDLKSTDATMQQSLTQLEEGIIDVISKLSEEGKKITNGIIAGELFELNVYNKKTGEAYSDEHISRTKRKLRDKGFNV